MSVKDVGEAAPSVVAEVIARVKSSMSAHTNRPKPEQQKITASENGECRLLGPFAILIQAALGTLALLSLVWKRWRETPRRPLKVWSFDVSKQVFGSCLLHIANLFMAMLSSGKFDVTMKAAAKEAHGGDASNQPNPCSFYLLNLAIDVSWSPRLSESHVFADAMVRQLSAYPYSSFC